MLVPIHVKSHFSLAYGTAAVEELVERARLAGLPALGLTDLENLYGQVRFHHACRARGLRPVTGLELRRGFEARASQGARRGRLVLLARDRSGYESLCRIVTRRRAGTAPGGPAGDPLESLEQGAEGLFVLTDDPQVLERLVKLELAPPERLGALVVRPAPPAPSAPDLLAAARRHGVRLVADLDVVMLEAEDRPFHELLIAIGRNETVAAVRRSRLAESPERRFRDPSAATDLFHDLPEAVVESRRIAESCELDLRHAPLVLPAPDLPAGETPASHLGRLCRERLSMGRRGGRFAGPAYDRRLGQELATIEHLGLAAYFLVVEEIVGEARRRGIGVAGRGSSAGSLVIHLLGAGEVDPVASGLLFERFLNARRAAPPDVDLDLDAERRDEMIAWVHRRFGVDRVAVVGALATFRRRSACRDGLKALGLRLSEVDEVCRAVPGEEEPEADPGVSSGAGPELPAPLGGTPPSTEAGRGPSIPGLPAAYAAAAPLVARLIGTPRHFSAHPGGIVVADGPIERHVPLERTAKGVAAAQLDMRSLEHSGLVKIDLLGNHFLTELAETLRLVESRPAGAVPEPFSDGHLRRVPESDPDTVATIGRADTIGCFQLESPAMRSLLAQIPIRGLGDCVAALALVRPGAAAGGAKRAFIRRANRDEAADDPRVPPEPALSETYGVLLYEEDVMRMLATIGGMALEEADEIRAAVVASGGARAVLAPLEERFLRKAAANGTEEARARRAWEAVARFAAYSFSKAHASSYGWLGYLAAYLRTHVPVEFGCAVLNHHGGLYPPRTLAAAVERWGVSLMPPSVNHSEQACTVDVTLGSAGCAAVEPPRAASAEGSARAVRIGLGKVKGLTRRSRAALLRSRRSRGPFADLTDLLARVPLSRPEVEALVLSGACDGLPPLSRTAYPFVHEATLADLRRGLPPREPARRNGRSGSEEPDDPVRLERYRALVRIQNELRFLEMHVSDHPMRVLRGEADRVGCLTTRQVVDRPGSFVRVAGILAASRRLATKTGEIMQFATLEDETGTLEAVLFPAVYRAAAASITTPGPFLLAGRVEQDHGDVHLIASSIDPFHERARLLMRAGA